MLRMDIQVEWIVWQIDGPYSITWLWGMVPYDDKPSIKTATPFL